MGGGTLRKPTAGAMELARRRRKLIFLNRYIFSPNLDINPPFFFKGSMIGMGILTEIFSRAA
jgi:hypothetical protein